MPAGVPMRLTLDDGTELEWDRLGRRYAGRRRGRVQHGDGGLSRGADRPVVRRADSGPDISARSATTACPAMRRPRPRNARSNRTASRCRASWSSTCRAITVITCRRARSMSGSAGQTIPILSGIDTRTLTIRLRERGTMQGWLYPASMTLDQAKQASRSVEMRSEVFQRVAPSATRRYEGGDLRVLLVDVGAKEGIVQCLRSRGAAVVRAPWHVDLGPLAAAADGVIVANGPGDPSDLDALSDQVRTLFGTFHGPVFGICMGHQIVGRAAGFGHVQAALRPPRREPARSRAGHRSLLRHEPEPRVCGGRALRCRRVGELVRQPE